MDLRGHVMAVTVVLARIGGADVVETTWVGPPGGSWSLAANWSPSAHAPNNGAGGDTYRVFIDTNDLESASVVLDTPVIIDDLTVDAGDMLTFSDGSDLGLALGPLTNNGTVFVSSSGALTELVIRAPSVSILGSGEILLSDSASNRVSSLSFGYRLIHGADHAIRGAGQFGANHIDLTNQGLIDADQPTALTVDLNGTDNFNQGTMQASAGGTLHLKNSTLDNTGGLIRALDGPSYVDLENTALIGGILETEGAGEIRTVGSGVVFEDIASTGVISVLDNTSPVILGTITNDGTIALGAAGHFAQLLLGASPVTITGSGEVVLSDATYDRLAATTFGYRLIHGSDHTIRGVGQLGINYIDLTNEGLVDADGAGTLTVDLNGPQNTNAGTMQASAGGTLHLKNTTLDNTGGVIRALDGPSYVELENTALVGGILETEGAGEIRTVGSGVVLEDIATSGAISVLDNTSPVILGTITNDGTIALGATGHFAQLLLGEPQVTITGGGEVVLSDATYDRLAATTHGYRLVHGSDHTIRGVGQLGINYIDLTNEGLIDADGPGTLTVNLNGPQNTNAGTMQASGGGTLYLFDSTLDNTGGVIRALDGPSYVDLAGTTLTGGILETEGSGEIRTVGNGAVLEDIATSGAISVLDNTSPVIRGTLTNDGTITLSATAHLTQLLVGEPLATITGGGEVVLSHATYDRIAGATYGYRLINDAGHTIRGAGQVGAGVIDVTNLGEIVADRLEALTIQANADFENPGTLRVSGGGTMTIGPGAFTTSGSVVVDGGGTLTRSGDFTQTAGVTLVEGELEVNGGVLDLQGGVLHGGGLIDAAVMNHAGLVRPGGSPGELSIEGDYDQMPGGTLEVELGGLVPGAEYDVLAVDGDVTLGGTLDISVVPPFAPGLGDEFTIITSSGAISGRFAFADCSAIYLVTYDPQAVRITVVEEIRPADLNCDGAVDVLDFLALLAAWGPCPEPPAPCPGDIDGNGAVDVVDFLAMLASWG
jgi:hypothetical protein